MPLFALFIAVLPPVDFVNCDEATSSEIRAQLQLDEAHFAGTQHVLIRCGAATTIVVVGDHRASRTLENADARTIALATVELGSPGVVAERSGAVPSGDWKFSVELEGGVADFVSMAAPQLGVRLGVRWKALELALDYDTNWASASPDLDTATSTQFIHHFLAEVGYRLALSPRWTMLLAAGGGFISGDDLSSAPELALLPAVNVAVVKGFTLGLAPQLRYLVGGDVELVVALRAGYVFEL